MSPGCGSIVFRRRGRPVTRPDELEDVEQLHPGPATNIVDSPGLPQRTRVDRGRHRVGHEREVPGLPPVAKDRHRLVPHRGQEKAMKPHVGPLPGAVHREVAHRHRRHAVIHVIQVAELLGGQLSSRRTETRAAAWRPRASAAPRRRRRPMSSRHRPAGRLAAPCRLRAGSGSPRHCSLYRRGNRVPSFSARRPAPPGGTPTRRHRAARPVGVGHRALAEREAAVLAEAPPGSAPSARAGSNP